jgi:hypothetical protein
LAALLTAPVTAHHAQSQPHQRPKQRGGHREEPKRPGEIPEEKFEPDALGVLDHEDDQQPHAGERGDRPTAEPASFRRRAGAVAAVPDEVKPGTYVSDGGEGCYWARLRDLTGGLNSIIANGGDVGRQRVTILRSDKGFKTSDCGVWRKVG